jgi:hypothetical protein
MSNIVKINTWLPVASYNYSHTVNIKLEHKIIMSFDYDDE